MKKVKYLCFDMDGTIADLYGVVDWLPMLRAELPTPYKTAQPMWDMERLARALRKAQAQVLKFASLLGFQKVHQNGIKRKFAKQKEIG